MLLVADCVGKRFAGRWVLSAATLRAVPGQVRALVGRNGAGKSTLLRIACGMLRAESGAVRIGGERIERPLLHRLAPRGVFYLPEFHLLLRGCTLADQFRMIARMSGTADIGPVADVLRVADLLNRRPGQLSGGERRRAEVAAAVLRRPRWLLADEPLRGIAPLDAELITRAFRDLAAAGCAVVITGHEVEALFDAADHVTWCTDGTTHELGPPQAAARGSPVRPAVPRSGVSHGRPRGRGGNVRFIPDPSCPAAKSGIQVAIALVAGFIAGDLLRDTLVPGIIEPVGHALDERHPDAGAAAHRLSSDTAVGGPATRTMGTLAFRTLAVCRRAVSFSR